MNYDHQRLPVRGVVRERSYVWSCGPGAARRGARSARAPNLTPGRVQCRVSAGSSAEMRRPSSSRA